MPHPIIHTGLWRKPIATDRFDWSAITDDYEPGDPIGFGATEAQAIADLEEQLADRAGEAQQEAA